MDKFLGRILVGGFKVTARNIPKTFFRVVLLGSGVQFLGTLVPLFPIDNFRFPCRKGVKKALQRLRLIL